MKLLFEAEDCLVGIGIGLLMIGLSGKYYNVPEWNILWGVVFSFSFIMTILDVIYTFSDIGGHIVMLMILFVNNAIDGVIEIALAAKYFGFDLGKISTLLNPHLDKPEVMFALGIFFIASSVFWLIYFPFMQ